jgi:hypothetical protein
MTSGRPNYSFDQLILRSAALLVPRRQRAEWWAEWRAELYYVLQASEGRRASYNRQAMLFCLGAFRDAMWLRRHNCNPEPPYRPWLQSPWGCVFFLTTLAAVAAVFFLRSPGPLDTLVRASRGHAEVLFPHVLILAIALVILPATTPLTPAAHPARHFRRWLFAGFKISMLLAIVFCGTIDLAPVIGAGGVQPHATLIGYVLAFRWALIDQRRRCPVCLRLLTNPVSIGQPAQTFLDWYGTELFCIKGHGLLHVPAISTSYSTQRWLDLDTSWSGLFVR